MEGCIAGEKQKYLYNNISFDNTTNNYISIDIKKLRRARLLLDRGVSLKGGAGCGGERTSVHIALCTYCTLYILNLCTYCTLNILHFVHTALCTYCMHFDCCVWWRRENFLHSFTSFLHTPLCTYYCIHFTCCVLQREPKSFDITLSKQYLCVHCTVLFVVWFHSIRNLHWIKEVEYASMLNC